MTVGKIELGQVAWIDASLVNPTLAQYRDLPHVSAEHICSVTGELRGVKTALADGMTSSKYLFQPGDVLYSKLRPYLRKAAIPEYAGLCSADMYPLKMNLECLLPSFFRILLVSDDFTSYANEESARSRMPKLNREQLFGYRFVLPSLDFQRAVERATAAKQSEMEVARRAAREQLNEIAKLATAIVTESIRNTSTKPCLLGDVLDEVKHGIGASWADHPVLGATREGLAPAKEQPGKMAPKYKPVTPGTVFYNPMRILIGSIAFVDEDDTPGITSPDYVALRGKPGRVDSRWFYYWLRSHLGAQCILSLARGAVRERMLFNRLADGKIDLPSPEAQEKASRALRELKPLQRALKSKLAEIDLLPQKILAQAFEM